MVWRAAPLPDHSARYCGAATPNIEAEILYCPNLLPAGTELHQVHSRLGVNKRRGQSMIGRDTCFVAPSERVNHASGLSSDVAFTQISLCM